MLVLTRKAGQSLMIGDNIRLTLLSVEGDRVSLGVDAPRSVRVYRSELLEETQAVNREAAAAAPGVLLTLKKAEKTSGAAGTDAPKGEPSC